MAQSTTTTTEHHPRVPLRELSRADVADIGRRTLRRISAAQLTDRAAALTYYAVLSLFPAAIVGVALLAAFGSYPETYEEIMGTVREVGSGPAVDAIDDVLDSVLQAEGAARGLLGIGLLGAVFTASAVVGAASRALDELHGSRSSRPFLAATAHRLVLTLAIMALLLTAFLSVVVAGPILNAIGDEAGIGGLAQASTYLRWPVGLAAILGAVTVVFMFGPSRDRPALSRTLPGALLAAALWLLASFGFSAYVANFGNYDVTYGALGAVIVLLVWLWISSLALFVGAALNVELEAGPRRQIPMPSAAPEIGEAEEPGSGGEGEGAERAPG